MNRIFTACVVLLLSVTWQTAKAREITYLEDFALATDRAEALRTLIPGTEDYYYYHCLHYQNTEQFDQVEQLLKAWIKRYKYTSQVREILNRQSLLTYSQNPRKSLEYIRQRLNLQFNHQRDTIGKKPNLPTALNQDLISRQTLQQHALRKYKNLQGFEDHALDWLVSESLNPDRRRHLLERLQRPDHANLAQLVIDDLNYKYSRGFGQFAIHRQLLLSQLDECLELKPDLRNEQNFVHTYISKLLPSDDVDWANDDDQYRAYLDRLWTFAERLAPVHNSLKAHILYHRLVLDRRHGEFNKQTFMTYLRLPRQVAYVNQEYLRLDENRRYVANLEQDFSSVTHLPTVGHDEPLVRSYLHHFFTSENTYEPYTPYVNDTYLKHNFAETKIVNGLGEPEQWYSLLPPTLYQQLKERVDLDFAHTNKRFFDAGDEVRLDLLVKNVETLIVNVFQINTSNYYRQYGREVNTDVNLDGLVANEQLTYTYEEPPLRRVKRHFNFPSLSKRGVYVIDFIGNGKSSRVAIRKGKLRHLVRTTTAGHEFTVLDEQNQRVSNATLWLAGNEYKSAEDGTITIPFTNAPGRQPIILTAGDFSSLGFFQHQSENYALAAGIYVDRESLLSQRKAQVLVRPGLTLNGIPSTPSVLEDTKLVLRSTDHDGVSSTQELNDFKLYTDRESLHEFQVPQRLAQLEIILQAKVQNLSQNKKIDLTASEVFTLNEIDGTEKIEDLHLVKIDGHYYVDVLGKSGEAKSDRPVQLSIKHRDFRNPVAVTLKSDATGRVTLGPLDGISSISATGPEGTSHTWQFRGDDHTYLGSIHSAAKEVIELPYMGPNEQAARTDVSLLELRDNVFVADRFESVSVGNGLVRVTGLTPGDYDLLLKDVGQRIRIRITAGEEIAQHVLGQSRQLEVRGDHPLQIDTVKADGEQVNIQLRNSSKYARVHVFATRYEPAYSAFANLSRIRDVEPIHERIQKLASLYAEGRDIGDELRYIIERKLARKFPGNMLQRPSMLLNPWAIRKTETETQQAAAGEDFDAQPDSEAAPGAARRPGESRASGSTDYSNLDFLSDASAVLLNLKPNENGVVLVDRAALGSHQHIHIVAVDPRNTAYRSLTLREVESEPLDLRLAEALDLEGKFTQQKRINVVDAGESFVIPDISSSRYEIYDSLSRVYGLYTTLNGNPNLAEFRFILDWPDLGSQEKQDLYSRYACHELNFFIANKDPEFFARVVRPYLVNKKDKTFLDHWLVQNDLSPHLRPWNHSRLNIVERILLGQRADGEQAHTQRHVQDLFYLIPPDIDRFNFLFDTALRGSSLEADGVFAGAAFGRMGAMGGAAAGDPLSRIEADRWEEIRGEGAVVPFQANLSLKVTNQQEVVEESLKQKSQSKNRRQDLSRRLSERRNRAFFADDKAGLRKRMKQFYRKLDTTQEWVENNYYKLPIEQQNENLVTVNAFWNDYARHDPRQPFYSINLAEASRNFTEMMFALAVLDLPFEPHEHSTELDQAKLTLTPGSPMVVFHEQIRQTEQLARQTPILVSQNYYRHGDRYTFIDNQRQDKFVTDEYLVHTVYGCQIVVTNPTSSPQKLDLLLQVPVGAIPVMKGRYTRSVHIDLEPFNTKTLDYHFYFPVAGQYDHYPVHVAKNEELLARAEPKTMRVVNELSQIDRQSWDYISQFGSEQEVLSYLRQNNIHRLDLDRIAFRMGNERFFKRVTALLSERHVYHHTLWSYGIKHNDLPSVRQYLQHADAFVQQCGSYLDSPLLTIDPVVRATYQHMEYRPLVNARTHRLGQRRQILNDRFYDQYHRLLKVLTYRRDLSQDDLMAVTYYMLLQDRIGEAIDYFGRVRPDSLETRIQYDYVDAYLDMHTEDVSLARRVVDKYVDYPVDRWRLAFANIRGQLDELRGRDVTIVDKDDRTQVQTSLTASQPSFEFKVESSKVRLNYQNLESVQVNFYLMDIELLFSRNPFVQNHSGQFSHIRPNDSVIVQLPKEKSIYQFDLPRELHNRNVLVEIIGGGQTKSQAYYSNSLTLQVVENYGQLSVTHSDSRQPVPVAYVKVYARMQDGSITFYKDGYTDLRGRFDYTSLSTNELDSVEKLSLLIYSDQYGAAIKETSPPKR